MRRSWFQNIYGTDVAIVKVTTGEQIGYGRGIKASSRTTTIAGLRSVESKNWVQFRSHYDSLDRPTWSSRWSISRFWFVGEASRRESPISIVGSPNTSSRSPDCSKIWWWSATIGAASGSLPMRYFVAISQAVALLTRIWFSGFWMIALSWFLSCGSSKSHHNKMWVSIRYTLYA